MRSQINGCLLLNDSIGSCSRASELLREVLRVMNNTYSRIYSDSPRSNLYHRSTVIRNNWSHCCNWVRLKMRNMLNEGGAGRRHYVAYLNSRPMQRKNGLDNSMSASRAIDLNRRSVSACGSVGIDDERMRRRYLNWSRKCSWIGWIADDLNWTSCRNWLGLFNSRRAFGG